VHDHHPAPRSAITTSSMTYFILYIVSTFCTVMWNVGMRLVTDDGSTKPKRAAGILNVFRKNSIKFLPEKLHKPLISCVTCMGSIWGTIWALIVLTVARNRTPLKDDLWGSDEYLIFGIVWLLTMVTAAYTGTILWLILNKLRNG